MKLVSKAIARILFVLGYTDVPSHLLQKVSKLTIDYIKSLTEMMVKLKPEDGSISVDLLEVALQQKGINGIGELHSFYSQRIVKFHDGLYLKCKHLCDDLKNNLDKPDAPPKKDITESVVNEECSSNVKKKEQGHEANIEDSRKISLDSGVLAEDLYLRKKLKKKSVRFAPQTQDCEMSNQEDSCRVNIDSYDEKYVKSAIDTKPFSNVLTEDTVSLESTKIDSNLTSEPTDTVSTVFNQIRGLFSNSVYYSDDEPLDQGANIDTHEDKVPVKIAVCYSDDEPSNQFENIDTHDEKNPVKISVCYSDDESLDQGAYIATDKEKVPVINAGCYSDEEPLEHGTSVVTDKEKTSDETSSDSELIDEPSDECASVVRDKVPNKHAIGSESFSNSENLCTENISAECVKPNSDLFSELNSAVSKNSEKISSDQVCNSYDKPLRNHNVKRKAVDSENLESLCDSPTVNRKKRRKLMKHEDVSKNNTNMDVMSPKIKASLKRLEHSSTNGDYNVESNLRKNELGTASKENSCCNYPNPETNSKSEISSSAKSKCEIINSTLNASNSSENDNEQIWVSL